MKLCRNLSALLISAAFVCCMAACERNTQTGNETPEKVTFDRVACIGDSLTYGHAWHNESYPVYLQELLGEDVEVRNFGVNGAAVTDRSDPAYKLKYDTLQEYRDSLAFEPDVVLIMLGSNDGWAWEGSEPSYDEEYGKLINSYILNGAKYVLLLTAPPTLENNAFDIPNDVLQNNVYPLQKQIAQDFHLPLVDVRAAIQSLEGGYENLYRPGDGVHLSVEGAQFVARLAFEAIEKL